MTLIWLFLVGFIIIMIAFFSEMSKPNNQNK